jgi:outer membrane lipoprotein LolB
LSTTVPGARPRRSALRSPLLLALVLASCKTVAPPVAPGPDASIYSGKFSLHVTGAEREQSMSGRFALTVVRGAAMAPSDVTLDLSTPLGTTVARIRSGPDGATVVLPDHGGLRTEQGADADELSQRVLGWSLPVAGIGDWIEGRPAQGRPYRLSPGEGGASLLEQDGWTIRIDPRGADGRVRRMDMDRAAAGIAPAVTLRVVVDSGA